jgi:alginate O-acetyltransferase complex protein AlgI
MLFTSFYFLPWLALVLTFTFLAQTHSLTFAKICVIAASLFFYISWSLCDLYFLIVSITGNFIFCVCLWRSQFQNYRRWILSAAIVLNVSFIVMCKLAIAFPALQAYSIVKFSVPHPGYLPLGISFFTFQQIAFLVQVARDQKHVKFVDYFFVVSFFPHLIAGPLLQQRDILPQIGNPKALRFNARLILVGLMLFAIGLGKKLYFADSIAVYATDVFTTADQGHGPGFINGWLATMACLLQFYFDFSGYSDMASGVACMFGIKLPLNFYSPLKASSLAEFWRRWNMTLGRFLEHYVFRNLAGFRPSLGRHCISILITMFLAGAWHGATLNFMLWGIANGLILIGGHGVRMLPIQFKLTNLKLNVKMKQLSLLVFLLASSCLFYAKTLTGSVLLLKAILGLNGWGFVPSIHHQIFNPFLSLPWIFYGAGLTHEEFLWLPMVEQCGLTLILFGIIYLCPNSYQILRRYRPMKDSTGVLVRMNKKLQWSEFALRLTPSSLLLSGVIMGLCLLRMMVSNQTDFNYYGF